MMRFSGQVAIVTGAAGGIGRAVVQRLVGEGATVIATDINAESLAASIAASGSAPGSIHALVADVAAASGPAEVVAAAIAIGGRIDLLINNAGIGGSRRAEETSDDDFDRFLSVNLRSVFRLSREAIPAMKQRGGAIVNIASIYGLVGFQGTSSYAAAKAGVIGLTRQMAADCGPCGIRINAISPGLIETDMTLRRIRQSGWFRGQMTDMTPLGRNGRPEDIAAAVAFLCSDDASFITAENLTVDGGWLGTRYRDGLDHPPPATQG